MKAKKTRRIMNIIITVGFPQSANSYTMHRPLT